MSLPSSAFPLSTPPSPLFSSDQTFFSSLKITKKPQPFSSDQTFFSSLKITKKSPKTMKILCDVCDKDEATVYCTADDAALCAACDHRVHHANKLAGKHQRFTLRHPQQAPLCDICKERSAFLFCLQDRAILCRECDISIHKANEHTQKHARFLLTGVKLSSKSTLYSESTPSSAESASSTLTANNNSKNRANKTSGAASISTAKSKNKHVSSTIPANLEQPVEKYNFQLMYGGNSNGPSNPISGSSISEYLTEMLPGWHVEDFLDSSPYAFSKNGGIDDLLPLWDGDFDSNMSGFPTEKGGLWAPQVAPGLHDLTQNQTLEMATNGLCREQSKEFLINNNNNNNNIKSSRKYRGEDNSFAVPQISPLAGATKRSRNLW